MTAQRSEELLVLLQDAGFEFVVVGGVAAIAHGATRSTKDLDVVAPFTAANIERLLAVLGPHRLKHASRPDLPGVWQAPAELATHRVILLTCDLGRLDVLRELPPVGGYSDVESVEMSLVSGRTFRVITLEQLIAIKASLTRPQDKDVERDLRAILALREREPANGT